MMPFDDELDEGPLTVGQIFINKFEVVRLIGRGGYAFVYEARHGFMGHRVALKLLHRPGGVSKEMLARGRVEARIQQTVKHPNIVQIDDAGITDDGQLYMVMELLGGRTLQAVLHEHGRLEVEEALHLCIQAARGMHAAHKLGVVHRDLKPGNIFLVEGNLLKVIDFGVAKAIDLAKFATQKNMMLGTPNYMSPEQVRGNPITPATDIYTLGIILYEILSGIQPVDHAIGTQFVDMLDLARVIAFGVLTPLDELDPRIPRYVADLVATACSKKPNERFASMEALAIAAEECLARYKAEAKRAGRSLQTRDLSRQGKVRSGVELKDSARAAVPGGARSSAARSDRAGFDVSDTERSAVPFSAPAPPPVAGPPAAAPQHLEPAVRTAPLPRPAAASERPTLWAKPGSEPTLPPMQTAPIGSPASHGPPRSLPRPAAALVAQPEPVAAPAPVLAQARSASTSRAAGHHVRPVLVFAALAGFTLAGGVAFFLPNQQGAANQVPSANLPAATAQTRAPQLPAADAEVTPVAPTAASEQAPPPPADSATPVQAARAPATAPARSNQPPARPAAATSAPSKAAINKMEQKLRRLEKDLDKPKGLWLDE